MSRLSAERHAGGVGDLAEEWRALHAADPAATPFATPAWAIAWCRHFPEAGDPWLVCVRDGERLVGLAALVAARRGPVRTLRGLGSGVGNFWDVLAVPERREAVVAAVAGHLADQARGWEVLDLDRLEADSPTPARLAAAGLTVRDRRGQVAPVLALPATWEDYLAGLSRSRRARVRKHLRPVDAGEIEIRMVTDPVEVPGLVDRWQQLRRAWWAARERPINPEHASDRFRRFTADVVAAMLAEGTAVVRELRIDGEVASVALDFVDRSRMYYWLNGSDPRHESLRLGHVVVAHGIRLSIERGLSVYDFMIGAESYKYDYGAVDRELRWIVASNPSARSRAAALALRARDRLRPPGDAIARAQPSTDA